MPVLDSCDDEPPEPHIDRTKDHFCSVVLVEVGVGLTASPFRPATARADSPKRKIKARSLRSLRPLRSLVLLATLLDEGCGLQSLASLWKSSVRSLQHEQSYWELSRGAGVLRDTKPDLTSWEHVLEPSATLSESRRTPEINSLLNSSPGECTFSIPHIVVTPAADEGLDVSLNQVFTPQDAGHGNLLTVPDPDLEVINQSAHVRTLFDSPHLRRERLYSFPGACKKRIHPPLVKEPSPVTRVPPLETLQEDEDEALDLGRTWSG